MKPTNSMTYPFIFQPEEEGGYFIECPDLQGAYTGIKENNIAYGIAMAEEVLGMTLATCIELGEEIPKPSKVEKITLTEGEFVHYVKVDVNDYLREQELGILR